VRARPRGHSIIRTVAWLRKYAFAVATVVVAVGVLRVAPVTRAAGAAPVLLLCVVIVARFWGLGPALMASGFLSAAYSYYFLPPAGFAIHDPEDWVAFFAFIVTAVIAGELASRAQRRAAEAQAGRVEIERLYQELKNAFDRASEAEAARRNEALKSALLDALTHNLRTPLTAIKASVTALLGDRHRSFHTELSSEGRKELLQIIDEESDRLNRFIEGLSTPESAAPAQPLHLRAVALDDVVRAGLMRAETLTRDHHLVVKLDDALPPVSIDAPSLAEVVYILLDNASKYASTGTAITIHASRHDERFVQMTVSDEGPGIAPDLRERVFEKFYRVPKRNSHDSRRTGIGLGLPIARRLVEAQGGRIWIAEPGSGRGTTVAMLLPLAVEQTENEPGEVYERAIHDDRQIARAGGGR